MNRRERLFAGAFAAALWMMLNGGAGWAQDTIAVTGAESSADSLLPPAVMSPRDTFTVEGELELRTGDNLDSLLNLWYVNQSLETAVDDYDPEADTLMPDFPG